MPNMVVNARWRLAALGISQCAHFLAIYCLRAYVVLLIASEGATQRDTAWHLVSALFMLPSIFFVPVYGALGNSLPKRAALVGAAAYCLLIVALFAWWGQGWLVCIASVALGSSLYTSTRHALLPAAAQDTQLPLPRVVSAIETGAVLSIVGGLVLGGALMPVTWSQVTSALSLPEGWAAALERHGLAVTVAIILSLKVFCLVTALPVRFASDVYRPEAPRAALRGFFRDCSRLLTFGRSRSSLLAVCVLRGAVTASAGALIADSLAHTTSPSSAYQMLIVIAVLTMLGAAVGSFLAGLVGDRRRTLGLVPFGATGMVLALGWVALVPPAPALLCVLVGACGGVVNVPLLATYQDSVPPDARGNGMAILNTAGFVSMTAMSLLMAGLAGMGVLTSGGQLWFVAALSALGAVTAWWALGTRALGLLVSPLPRLPAPTGVGDDESASAAAQTTWTSKSPE
jgi:MFS family permease